MGALHALLLAKCLGVPPCFAAAWCTRSVPALVVSVKISSVFSCCDTENKTKKGEISSNVLTAERAEHHSVRRHSAVRARSGKINYPSSGGSTGTSTPACAHSVSAITALATQMRAFTEMRFLA